MRRLILFSAIFVFLAVPVWASEKEEVKFNLGGEVRFRSETLARFDSFTPARSATAGDSFILMRARTRLEAVPTEAVRIFLEPQFSRTFAQEESTIANTRSVDDLDLHQGYLDFPKIGGSPLSLRLGRQELIYGDERLIGAFGWSNVGRSFDAAKWRLEWPKFRLDGFFSWIQRAGGNQYFGGLYGHGDVSDAAAEPYFLVLRDNDGGLGGRALTVYTLGGRLAGLFREKWDYGLEGALQTGESASNTIFAYAGHAHGGYTFDAAWEPRAGVEYNVASGDEAPATGRVKTFNNLFPTNHDKYGYMDLVGLRNIHNPRLSLKIKPVKGLAASLDYHAFWLMEPRDGLFLASGAQGRAGAAGASRFVGQEIDWLLQYEWNRWAKFLLGYSFFKAGRFLSDTGVKKDAHFLYAQTLVTF